MKKFIVIPTYNEKENLDKIVKAIFDLKIKDLHLIIVDDNSPDGTGQLADSLTKKYDISVLHRRGKLGLGTAYIEGFKKAIDMGADVLFEMDADLSHNPEDLPRFIEEINKGNDVVIGSRRIKGGNVKGWNWYRNLQSQLAMAFARLILGLKTQDITAGFRCYTKKALEKINFEKIESNGYAFQEEMIYYSEKENLQIKEIPVTFIDREFGQSKLKCGDIVEFFVTVFKLRFSK